MMSKTNEKLIADLQSYIDGKISGELPVRIKIEVIAAHGDKLKVSTRKTKVDTKGDYQWEDTTELL